MPPPARMEAVPPSNCPAWPLDRYSLSSHPPKKNASSTTQVTNTIWNVFNDISRHVYYIAALQGQQGQRHQRGKKEHGADHHRINQFLLRNEVHEKAGHQKALGRGDDQGGDDVDLPAAKVDEGGPDRQARADRQRHADNGVGAHVLFGLFNRMPAPVRGMCYGGFVHISSIKGKEPGTGISRPGQQSARKGRRLPPGWCNAPGRSSKPWPADPR